MVIRLRAIGLYRVTMGTENQPNSIVEKSKFFNRMDEAFGMLCLNISRDLLFNVKSITTQNEVCFELDSLFWKNDELRVHQLEDKLITLNPTHFETIQDYFTKFKSLVLQPKKCGIENK